MEKGQSPETHTDTSGRNAIETDDASLRKTCGIVDQMPRELGFIESDKLWNVRMDITDLTSPENPPANSIILKAKTDLYDILGKKEAELLSSKDPANSYVMAGYYIQRIPMYMRVDIPAFLLSVQEAIKETQSCGLTEYAEVLSRLLESVATYLPDGLPDMA